MVFYNKFDIETLESVATGNSKSDLSNIKNKLNRARDTYFNGRDAKFKIPNFKNILEISLAKPSSLNLMAKSYPDHSIKLNIMNNLFAPIFIIYISDLFDYNYDFDDFVNRYMILYKIIFKMYHIIYISYYDRPIDTYKPVYVNWCGIHFTLETINRYVRELTGDNNINYVQYYEDDNTLDESTLVFTAEKRQHLYDLLMVRYGNLFRRVLEAINEKDDINLYLLKILSDTIVSEYNIKRADMSDVISDSNIIDYEIEVVDRWISGNKELLVKSASKK